MEKSLENKELQLDHRHLLLFFLTAVVICASFFALGFVVGRGQAREATLASSSQPQSDRLGSSVSGKVKLSTAGGAKPVPAGDPDVNRKSRQPGPESSGDYRKELDFYSAVKDQRVDENFSPRRSESKKVKQRQSKPQKTFTRSSPQTSGLLHLQVAAVKNRADAERLTKELRVKGYPVFVVSPSKTDSPQWIRVQVGPFSSAEKTSQVKAQLARDGYQSILRR